MQHRINLSLRGHYSKLPTAALMRVIPCSDLKDHPSSSRFLLNDRVSASRNLMFSTQAAPYSSTVIKNKDDRTPRANVKQKTQAIKEPVSADKKMRVTSNKSAMELFQSIAEQGYATRGISSRYKWAMANRRAQQKKKKDSAENSLDENVSQDGTNEAGSSEETIYMYRVRFQLFESVNSNNNRSELDESKMRDLSEEELDARLPLFEDDSLPTMKVLMRMKYLPVRNKILDETLQNFIQSLIEKYDMESVRIKKENEEDFGLEPRSAFQISKVNAVVFDIKHYNDVVQDLKDFSANHFANELGVGEIPPFVRKVLFEEQKKGGVFAPVDLSDDISWDSIPKRIQTNLLPYQHEGIIFGVKRGGRILLADEMGLGKTIQAIALACYYKSEWPLLIICPSTLRVNWKKELIKWEAATEDEILIVDSGNKMDTIPNYKVSIVSYELLARSSATDFKPKVVIVDESHFVKSTMSKRTRATRPFIRNSKRAFLLSGTATPSRPIELYDQIRPLFNDRSIKFMTKAVFGERYCDVQETPFGANYSGASNIPELNLLLSRTIMIRRLKKHVLGQLRPKNRRLIFISRTYDDAENQRIQEEAAREALLNSSIFDFQSTEATQIIQQFLITGKQKIPLVCEYLKQRVFSRNDNEKYLLFAHHQCVLDGIERELIGYKDKHDSSIEYIRIDGNTPNQVRSDLADYFCSSPNCKYAILSLTCAGTGLNFQTNCSNVIFCELFWTPGVLLQAEDRVHRIGTSSETTVDVRYLICDGTLDDHIWPLLQKKLDIVGTTLDRHTSNAAERREHFKTNPEDELL